jgi:hypothetical protein
VLRLYAAGKNGVKVTRHIFDKIFNSFQLLAFSLHLANVVCVFAEVKCQVRLLLSVFGLAKS